MSELVVALRTLFRGAEGVYGTYLIDALASNNNGKVGGKALTVKKPVTDKLWEQHVSGQQSIGIVPVMSGNMSVWGCIDVDKYPAPIKETIAAVKKKGYPLNLCLSKSGGIHLFLFSRQPIPAIKMQQALRVMAAGLKLPPTTEIFPKQTHIDFAHGEIGNWLNMPYFGDTRKGLNSHGHPVSLETFLKNVVYFEGGDYEEEPAELDEQSLPDGPPCLQAIKAEGITAKAHNRNNTLMGLAVYYRKASPDNWTEKLRRFNIENVKPPLPGEEIESIITGIKRKGYNYQCGAEPLHSHCNRALCLTRTHGIKDNEGQLVPESVIKIEAGPDHLWKIWFAGESRPIEIPTSKLMMWSQFQLVYLQTLMKTPPDMKPKDWLMVVNLMARMATVQTDESAGPDSIFDDLLKKFLAKKTKSEKESIMRGAVFVEDDVAYFRTTALEEFLTQSRFTAYTTPKVIDALKRHGAESRLIRIGGNPTRVIRMPLVTYEPEPTPPIEEEPL